ncbi:MAG: HYR domain-containing protein [Saprospiraceae bacterium]|nr:HYR domain-containing protein [Saprospiraceae bacterium]
MNALSTKNHFKNLLASLVLVFVAFFGFQKSAMAQAPSCSPVMSGCLTQSIVTVVNVTLDGTCSITVPTLTGRWTAAANCSDGVNNWIFEPPLVQVPAAGTIIGPITKSGVCPASPPQPPIPVSIIATYSRIVGVGIQLCTITKGDMFSVVENTPPTFTLPPAVTLDVDSLCFVSRPTLLTWARSNATVNDNCTDNTTLINNIAVQGTSFVPLTCPVSPGPGGNATFRTTDACGNTATAVVAVTFRDAVAPTVTCPVAQTRPLSATCTYQLQDFRGLATASTTGCGTPNTLNQRIWVTATNAPLGGLNDFVTVVNRAGCPSNIALTVRICATDCFGNGATDPGIGTVPANCCTFSLTLVDQTPPVPGVCPANITLNADVNCNITVPDLRASNRFTDNCDPINASLIIQIPAPNSVFNVAPICSPNNPRAIPLTFMYTDCNNNGPVTLNCPNTLFAADVTGPTVINCPATVPVFNLSIDPLTCSYGLTTLPANWFNGRAVAVDNCDPNPMETNPARVYDCDDLGLNLVPIGAVDCSGNPYIGPPVSCNVLVQADPADALWRSPGMVCQTQLPLDLCSLIDVANGAETCGYWSGDAIDSNFTRCVTGPVLFNPTKAGFYSVTYTVGDANCHVELTRSIMVMLDPPTTNWFISSISKCICRDYIIDFESFLKANDSIPRGGTWSIVTNITPAITLQGGVGTHLAKYNGGCGNITIRYSLVLCNGNTVSQDYTFTVRECANVELDYPDEICQDEPAANLTNRIRATANGCSDYTYTSTLFDPNGVAISVVAGTIGNLPNLGIFPGTLIPGVYTLQAVVADPTGVCSPDTAKERIVIYAAPAPNNGIVPVGPLCENATFPITLNVINPNDVSGNPLSAGNIRWSGAGVTDNGITGSFNPPDLDGDGRPGPGLFTVCVDMGDARCEDHFCIDILINNDLPDNANDLVGNQAFCFTNNTFIPWDGMRASNSMAGGQFSVATISTTLQGILLPNGYFYISGCGTITLTYTLPNDCNPDIVNNTIIITISQKPDVEISAAQSLCVTDASITITSNIPNGGLSGCPNTTATPWTVVPNRGLTPGTNSATFNPATAGEGTFVVQYIYSTAAGCADTARVTISVSAASDPAFSAPSPLCQAGPNVTLSLTNPNPSVQDGNILNGDNFQEVFWNASCGACITPLTDSTQAVFNPTLAGPGIHLVCVSTGDPSCMKYYCNLIRVVPITVATLRADTVRGCEVFLEGAPEEYDLEQFYLPTTTRGGTWSYVSGPGPGILNNTLSALPGCHQLRYTVTGELPTGACGPMSDDIFVLVKEEPAPYFAIQSQVCWSAGDPPANHVYTPFIQSSNYFPAGTLTRRFFISSGSNGTVNAGTGVVTITGIGTLTVCLEETLTYASCGAVGAGQFCRDTFCQQIIVRNGTSLNASFTASNTNPCAGEVVNLTAALPGGIFTGIGVVDGGGNGTGTFTPQGCGTFAITYTVDDPNGCNGVYVLNITTDRTRPTLNVPANLTVDCDGTGNVAQMNAWAATASASDNCPAGLRLTNRIYDRRSGCGVFAGTYVFEFRAEDSCRNITLGYANFVIRDTTRPAFSVLPSDLIIECGNATSTQILSWLNINGRAIASDICSGNRISWTHNYSGNIANYCNSTGELVTFTVRDECGNTNSASARIIVRDLFAPVWNVNPVNIKLECNGAHGRDPYSEVTAWLNRNGDGVAIDSCQLTVNYSNNFATQPWVGGCNRNTGSKTVTFFASDVCGNSSSRVATVSIIDTTRPIISSPAKDSVVNCDGLGNIGALNTWIANNGGARAIDDCSGSPTSSGILRWNNVLMRTDEGCGLTRTRIYMFTAVDSCNNVSAATIAKFIIQDTMVPIFVTNPQDITVPCDRATGAQAQLDAWLANNGGAVAVDVCAGGPLRWERDLVKELDLCSNTATYTYRFTAIDSCGNRDWRDARFIVIDNTPPVIDRLTGYDKITSCELLNAGNDDELVAWLDSVGGLRATDACSDVINWRHNFSETRWITLCGRTRTQAVTFSATDDCGNVSTRILNISTVDTTAPVFLNCPQPLVQDAEFGHCDAYVTVPRLIATDNCTDPVTITQIYGPNPLGFRFPVGTTILKYEARDDCNNRDTCTIKVVVNDYWDVPIITCPGNIDTINTTGVCGINGLGGLAPTRVADVCPHTAVTYVIKNQAGDTIKKGINDASGSNFPKGLNQVCYTVQDQPILLITEVTQQLGGNLVGPTSPVPGFMSAADINGDYIEVTNFGPSAIDISCMSIQIFEGGRLVGTFTLPAMPAVILPAGRVLTLHVGTAIPGFPDNPGQFFFNMNLPETSIINQRGYVLNHLSLRNIDAVTTNGYNLTAPAQGTPVLTANDWSGVSPSFANNGSYYRNCIFDFNSPRGWALAEGCEPASIGRVNPVLVPFVFPGNGRTTSLQTIQAQKATCCFNVNVRDVEAPMCANARDTLNVNGAVSTASGPGCFVFTVNVPSTPITKIGEVWIRNLNMTVTNFANTEAHLVHPDGTRVRLWDDGTCSGSTNFVASRISDLDNIKVANATCAVLNSGQQYMPAQALMAFCNKPAVGQWRLEIEVNTAAPSSLTLSSWQLTLINSGPSLLRDTTISNNPNLCSAVFMWNHPTVMDNCCMGTVDVTYTAIPTPGCPLHSVPTGGRVVAGAKETQTFGVGSTNISYVITDMSGNTATCSFILTVRDTQRPVILNCQKDYVANLSGGDCFYFFEVHPPTDARDNCDSIRLTYNPPLGTQLPIGSNKVSVTATDKAGNSTMCMWTITVVENNPPSRALACHDQINFSLDPNCRGVLTADMILSGDGYGCYDRYQIIIEDWVTRQTHINLFTIADVNKYFKVTIVDPVTGNKCWSKVLIEYKAIPLINCPPDLTVECNDPLSLQTLGNVSVASCILNYTTAYEDSIVKAKNCDTPFVFVLYRTFYLTNELGNTATCTQKVSVRPFDLARIEWPRHYDNLDLPALNCDQKIDKNKDVTPHMSDYPQCVDGYLLDSAYWLARPNQPDIYPARRIPMILGWNCIDLVGDPAFGHPSPDPVYFPQHRQWTPANPLCWGPNERVMWHGTGWPTLTGLPLRKDAYNCNLSMKYDDEVFDICDNSYEILRHWRVRNMCLPPLAGVNPVEFIQVIKVLDQKGPEIAYPDTVIIGTQSYSCDGIWEVPKPWIKDNCSDSVSFTVSTLNGNPILQNDGSWIIFNMKPGLSNVKITAQDVCGNKTVKTIHANVVDNTPPQAVCRTRTTVSITGNQTPGENVVKLFANSLDEGSYDNCQPHVWFKVIRMAELLGTNNGSNANNTIACNGINGDDNAVLAGNQVYFDDYTYFCCNDVNNRIMVVLRVFDVDPGAGPVTPARMTNANSPLRGRFADCMVEVEVQNKTVPTVVAPPNIVVSCWFWFDINNITDPSDPTFGRVVTDLTSRKKVVTNDIVCHKYCERNQRTQYPGFIQTNTVPKPAPNQACEYYFNYFDTAHWDRKYELVWGFDGYVLSGCGTNPTITVNDLRECGQGQIQRVISATGPNNLNVSAIQTIWVVDCDPFYVDNATCNDPRYTDLMWPNGVCTQTPVTVDGCGGDVSPDNPQLGRPTVVNNADDNCALISIEYRDEIFTIEPDACFKILRHWIVIDWCQYDPFIDPEFGRWEATQVIKVRDRDKPVVTCNVGPCEPASISTQLGVCVGHISLTAEATDNCSPIDWLLWEYKIDAYNDGKGQHGGYDYRVGSLTKLSASRGDTVEYSHNPFADDRHNPFDASGTYPIGVHKICWFVEDGCGNVGVCCTLFEIKDCKAPTPYCLTGIITVPMPVNGCIDIWAKDLDHGSFDNCTSKDNLKFYFNGDPNQQSIRICCDDFVAKQANDELVVDVEMWVEDEEGNKDYCKTRVIVQDNLNICPDNGNAKGKIQGIISNEKKVEAASIDVYLFNNSNMMNQRIGSPYQFGDLNLGLEYTIKPERNDDHLNGVSTADIVLIQKHILGKSSISSPYKLLAADVNASGNVSSADISEIRKLVLGITTQFSKVQSWTFVPDAYQFVDPANPYNAPRESNVKFAQTVNNETVEASFMAIKMGDVNVDAVANGVGVQTRTSGTLNLFVDEQQLIPGQSYSVEFKSSDFANISGYQFTLRFDPSVMVYEGMESGVLNTTDANFGLMKLNEGIITTSWNSSKAESFASEDKLFVLKFKANKAASLGKVLAITSDITRIEAYDVNYNIKDVKLNVRSNGTLTEASIFDLYQNEPNPVSKFTNISFRLPEASPATLTIYEQTGRVLRVYNINGIKGMNTISIKAEELNSSSNVLFYQLDSEKNSATRKMLLIK